MLTPSLESIYLAIVLPDSLRQPCKQTNADQTWVDVNEHLSEENEDKIKERRKKDKVIEGGGRKTEQMRTGQWQTVCKQRHGH